MTLTDQELRCVADTFLFSGYSQEALPSLLELCTPRRRQYPKHSIIYSQHEFRQELGLLLSGAILVSKGELVVSHLEQGALFGAAALFNEETDYVSTLRALSHCDILFFSQEAIQALIDREPLARRNFIRYLSQRIRFLSRRIDALTQNTGEKKLSSFLLQHMGPEGRIDLVCSMTELAARLNVGRATLYRELQKLEEQGIITRQGKQITVQRPELLSQL